MNVTEPQPAELKAKRPWFQFSLRTLLLFVVLGSSLAVFGAWGILIFVLVVGLAIYLHEAEPLWSWTRFALFVIILLGLAALLMPGIQSAREASRRTCCANNLHQIALALQEYHRANGCFPPAYVADKTGKPMHSWRVLILPYLDHRPLYGMYRFSEPWDGPNNKKLLAYRLPVFECPSVPPPRDGIQTSYVAVMGLNTAWADEKTRNLKDFGSNASKTIMLVEVTNAGISWAEPKDLSLDTLDAAESNSSMLAVSSNHGRREDFFFTYDYGSCVHVAMADGSVRYLRLGHRSIEDLRKLLQIGGFKEEEFGNPVQRLNWPNIASLAVWLLSVGTLLTHAVRSRKRSPAS